MAGSRAHRFVKYGNPERHKSCARCGRPEAAHNHPELQNAALISHGDMLRKAIGERSYSDVRFQLGVISKLLEEMDA